MTDKWTDRLSDYLDGELSVPEREALDAHLLECVDCGHTLQQLKAVVTRASQVIDREPSRDLWSGIAARIAAGEPSPATVVATSSGKRRISFSVPQLAAASVVLMLMSAGTMYMALDADRGAPVAEVSGPQAEPLPAGSASVRAVTRNYDAAVSELESVLHSNRDQLDSTTVRVLEQKPANPYLSRYLDQAMQKKVQLLRRATSVMRAET